MAKFIAPIGSLLAYCLTPAILGATGSGAPAEACATRLHETRSSSLAFAAPGHRTGRGGVRPLGTAARRLSDFRGRRVGTRKPGHDRGARRFYRCRPGEILQH